MKLSYKEILGIVAVVLLFALSAYLSQKYSGSMEVLVEGSGRYAGMFAYFALTAVAVVLAPVSILPLLPVAVSLWGEVWAIVLSVAGWTVGSAIAFLIARRWGRPIVQKIVSLKKIDEFEGLVAGKHLFLTVVVLRMVVPVDVLSYALGIFSKNISFFHYTLATFVGVIPFAVFFAYAAGLPVSYQIVALVLAFFFAVFGYHYIKRKKARKSADNDTIDK